MKWLKNVIGKVKTVLDKYKWWILGIVFLYPFYCLLIGEIWSFGELYTFGLPLRDFITAWIALGGIIGVVSNIILTQKRITLQENQQIKQQEQFEKQIGKQNDQIQIQQKQLSDTRFSSGVELLGNPNESARIGGAFNLFFLAKEFPDEYLNPVCEILCAHIRTITNDEIYQKKYNKKPSNEIQTLIKLLFQKDNQCNLIFDKCNKNLIGAFLSGTEFIGATISNVYFRESTLSGVSFLGARLCNVDFVYLTALKDVIFWEAKLSRVNFWGTKLCNVDFSNAEFKNEVYFDCTLLEGYCYGEITREGRSFELTANKSNPLKESIQPDNVEELVTDKKPRVTRKQIGKDKNNNIRKSRVGKGEFHP